ncbi:MAG: hypothetical protein R3293_00145 [Candidatus Promineifilaceae bacterium]|nr:hypothetical protein [Candidatus Promineifilaceae bacterium]
MRFIIHEQPYERPVSSGMWRYYHGNQPTGAVEKWRLTDAVDGFYFMRVDLDARAAASGRSYLYHLTADNHGHPVQLKFRLWDGDKEIIGLVLLEKDTVIVTREINGHRLEDVLPVENGYAFWYPASTGLGLLSARQMETVLTGVSLRTETGTIETEMSPFVTKLELIDGENQDMQLMDQSRTMKKRTIRWNEQQRTLWLDENRWPLKMERSDGLVAVESKYILFQRISRPSFPASNED